MTRVTFPQGFVWGSATSSFQIEGAVHEDGRGESIWDRFARPGDGHIKDDSNGDVACDHYHRWREDIALMKRLGHAAYRFSVAWPRVYPTGRGSAPVEKGLDFYSRLVDGLLEQGIAPYVTLYHWDLPQALEDAGGWRSRATVDAFAAYADAVTRRLGDRVKHWITHNEPWCSSMLGHQRGSHAPGIRDWSQALVASHHILLSHGVAVPIVRQNSRGAQVGITLNLSPAVPASPSAADADAARRHDGYMNRWYLEPIFRGQYAADLVNDYVELGYLPKEGMTCVRPGDMRQIAVPTDFFGINYYNRSVCRSYRLPDAENLPPTITTDASERTDIGWEVYPDGLFETLMRVHLEYRPQKIFITENGASYLNGPDGHGRVADPKRTAYVRDHLVAAHKAIQNGVPLAGYFAWSLMDNFEWEWGYTQRFGMTWVDYTTQERIPKDSALWYKRVIEENAIVE